VDELSAGEVLEQAQLAGEVSDVAAGGDAVVPALVAGYPGVARRRMRPPLPNAGVLAV
jgi:hypothetical protein